MVIALYAVNSAVKVLCLLCIAICCLGCVELLETGQMLHDVFKSHCLTPQHIVYAKASQESQRFCVCQEALQFWTQTKAAETATWCHPDWSSIGNSASDQS